MASMGGYELDATIRKVKGAGMVNKILQQICKGEGLTIYGVKAELQQKIIDSELVPEGYHAASSLPQFAPSINPLRVHTSRQEYLDMN
jgi:hypothetical protein